MFFFDALLVHRHCTPQEVIRTLSEDGEMPSWRGMADQQGIEHTTKMCPHLEKAQLE